MVELGKGAKARLKISFSILARIHCYHTPRIMRDMNFNNDSTLLLFLYKENLRQLQINFVKKTKSKVAAYSEGRGIAVLRVGSSD